MIYDYVRKLQREYSMINLFCVDSDIIVYSRSKIGDSTIVESNVLTDEQAKELYDRVMSKMPAQ